MASVKVIVSTPRGVITKFQTSGGGFTSRLEWNGGIDRFNVQYKNAQEYLDQAVVKDSTPFVPMQTGALYKSGQLGTTLGEGVVQWIAPYARYLYYGEVLVDPVTHAAGFLTEDGWKSRKDVKKIRSGRKLNISTSEHGKAQSFWFEAAKAQNGAAWIRNVRRIAGGG